MRITPALALLTISCPLIFALQTSQKDGAKALFSDPTSGAHVTSGENRKSGPSTTPRPPVTPAQRNSGSTTTVAEPTIVNTGLMYYVELIEPRGEVLRVNSTRVFHSGERIRLHFTSNLDGQITVVQKKPDGSSQVLFPDQRINGGNNLIKANIDTVLPSDLAFFKFDEKSGQEHLMVLLTAVRAESEKIASSPPTGDKAAQIASLITQESGSKDLFVEVDNSAQKPATYVVTSIGPDSKLPHGVVAVEIVLNHQP